MVPRLSHKSRAIPSKQAGKPVTGFSAAKANVKMSQSQTSGGERAFKGTRSSYAKGYHKG